MRAAIFAAIIGYQRYVSPYKGFGCAYRVHIGRQSCSALGFRAVRRYGVLAGLAVLRRRTYLCGVAHRRYSKFPSGTLRTQHGLCDVGCDLPCDFSGADGCFSFSDALNCCDLSSGNRKNDDKERHV